MEPTVGPDSGYARRAWAWVMILAAIVLGATVIYLWQHESDQVRFDQQVNDLAVTMGVPQQDIEANRAPAIGVGVVGGLLFLGGCILFAGAPPGPKQRPTKGDSGGPPY